MFRFTRPTRRRRGTFLNYPPRPINARTANNGNTARNGNFSAVSTAAAPPAPAFLGHYTLKRHIGSGNFGRVFLGQADDGPIVALKVIFNPSFSTCSHEAAVLQAATKDAASGVAGADRVVRLVDHFWTTPSPAAGPGGRLVQVLVLEYARGLDLDYWLSMEPSEEARSGELGPLKADIGSALNYLHSHLGIVHGDIKAANIFRFLIEERKSSTAVQTQSGPLTRSDSADSNLSASTASSEGSVSSRSTTAWTTFYKLGDLGLAHTFEKDKGPQVGLSATANFGTPSNWAPEQLDSAGACPIDPALDLWAFGCVLWRVAFGRHPFWNETLAPRFSLRQAIDQSLDDADWTSFGLLVLNPQDRTLE